MNMNAIMKQAKQMQAQMMKIQEKLADERVEATVGGGNGNFHGAGRYCRN